MPITLSAPQSANHSRLAVPPGWLRNVLRPSALWLAAPGLLYILVFLLLPCLRLLSLSLEDNDTGTFSIGAYAKLLHVGLYARVLSTTFSVAFQVTVLCLLLGYPLAYWLARQRPRRQRMLTLLVLFPFWTSALVKNFTWLVLLGRNGLVANTLGAIGLQAPDLLFSRGTVVFGMTHTMLPLAVISMLPVMNQIDRNLPSAAATMGASRAQAFWRVFFQLSMPGVASAGLLVFIASLGFFITPALLGGPRDTLLGQLIIQQIMTLQNWQLAGAIASMLITSVLATCLVYDRLFSLSAIAGGAAVKQRGRGAVRRFGMAIAAGTATLCDMAARPLGRRSINWLLPTYGWTMVLVLLLPILATIPMAFTSATFLSFLPPGLSLRWFAEYAHSEVWVGATLRSFGIGLVSGCLTLLLAACGAYGVARGSARLGAVVFLLFVTPMVVPSIVIAVALFYLFAQIGLVATNLGIVIGHSVTGIPLAFVILLAVLRGYDWRLNQAAATLGANRARAMWRVTLPLIKGGLSAAFIFAFLNSFEELTVALFVGGGLKTTLPRQMWDDVTLSVTPTLAAAAVIVLMVVTGLFLLAEFLRQQAR
jgi:putative spermidine/putrescine transport system permease protein